MTMYVSCDKSIVGDDFAVKPFRLEPQKVHDDTEFRMTKSEVSLQRMTLVGMALIMMSVWI